MSVLFALSLQTLSVVHASSIDTPVRPDPEAPAISGTMVETTNNQKITGRSLFDYFKTLYEGGTVTADGTREHPFIYATVEEADAGLKTLETNQWAISPVLFTALPTAEGTKSEALEGSKPLLWYSYMFVKKKGEDKYGTVFAHPEQVSSNNSSTRVGEGYVRPVDYPMWDDTLVTSTYWLNQEGKIAFKGVPEKTKTITLTGGFINFQGKRVQSANTQINTSTLTQLLYSPHGVFYFPAAALEAEDQSALELKSDNLQLNPSNISLDKLKEQLLSVSNLAGEDIKETGYIPYKTTEGASYANNRSEDNVGKYTIYLMDAEGTTYDPENPGEDLSTKEGLKVIYEFTREGSDNPGASFAYTFRKEVLLKPESNNTNDGAGNVDHSSVNEGGNTGSFEYPVLLIDPRQPAYPVEETKEEVKDKVPDTGSKAQDVSLLILTLGLISVLAYGMKNKAEVK